MVAPFQYKAVDFVVPGPGRLEISWTPAKGDTPGVKEVINDFKGAGVALGMFNTDDSIRSGHRQRAGFAVFSEDRFLLHMILSLILFLMLISLLVE